MILCIYQIEYVLIYLFCHFFCTRIFLQQSPQFGGKELRCIPDSQIKRKADTLSYKLSPKCKMVIGYKCRCTPGY